MDINLDEDLKQLCMQLRDRLSDIKVAEEYRVMDFNLLRFLKARNMDLDKAEDMFRKYIAWRTENEIDNALSWEMPMDLKENIRHRITGLSLDGGIVACADIGLWNPALSVGRYEDILKYAYHQLERLVQLHKYLTLRSNRFSKIICIVNLEGLTLAHVTTVDWIRTTITLLKVFEAYYPETLNFAYILNAPWLFPMLWSIIKPFISTETHKRLRFLGSDQIAWKTEITKCIAEDQFSMKYGGTLPDDFELIFEDGKLHAKQGDGSSMKDKNENKDATPTESEKISQSMELD